jgi:hypothetical protein
VGLAGWIALTCLSVAGAMVRGEGRALSGSQPAPAHGGRAVIFPLALAATGILAAAAISRAPSRLAANGLALAVWAPVLWWVLARRAGGEAAAQAMLALSAFTLIAATADLRNTRFIEDFRPDSPFRWSVGWPQGGWVLRYQIHLDSPAPARRARLRLPLARIYEGNARIYAALNGHDLGTADYPAGGMEMTVSIPADSWAGLTDLVFELREDPVDPSLRLLAQPWAGGASLGLGASSYFDGARWQPGTYNDAMGRAQPGIYVVRLEIAE